MELIIARGVRGVMKWINWREPRKGTMESEVYPRSESLFLK